MDGMPAPSSGGGNVSSSGGSGISTPGYKNIDTLPLGKLLKTKFLPGKLKPRGGRVGKLRMKGFQSLAK